MCVITDEKHIVHSISLIPGTGTIPSNWNCYFPVRREDLPRIGEYFNPK